MLMKNTSMPPINTLALGLLPLPLFFEGLHAFSHTHFCPAALWFRFSESLANLGGLHVCCWDLTQPRPQARITFASAQQSVWQPLFTDHIQEV